MILGKRLHCTNSFFMTFVDRYKDTYFSFKVDTSRLFKMAKTIGVSSDKSMFH